MKSKVPTALVIGFLFVGGHFLGRALLGGDEDLISSPLAQPIIDIDKDAAEKPEPELPHQVREMVELLERTPSAALDELPALVHSALGVADAELRRHLLRRLGARWGQLDPARGAAWLTANVDEADFARGSALRGLFGIWAQTDPDAAIRTDPDNASDVVWKVTARHDPERFFALLEEFQPGWRTNESTAPDIETALGQLAGDDPSKLSRWLDDDNQPEFVATAAARVMAAILTKADSSGAYAALAQIANPVLRAEALGDAMELLRERDRAAADRFFDESVAAGTVTPQMRHALLRAKALDDPFAAARLLATWPKDAEAGENTSFLRTVSMAIPPDAASLHRFATEFGTVFSDFSINNVIVNNGGYNHFRQELADGLISLPQDETRDEIIVALVSRWIQDDPAAAMEFAKDQTMSDWPSWQAAQKEAFGWRQFGSADEVFSVVEELEWQHALPKDAMELVSAEAPDRAIAHIAALDPAEAAMVAPVLAGSFALRDPEGGIAWIEGLADSGVQVGAAEAFARASAYDIYTLSEWATTLPAGAVHDAVASVLAETVAAQEPQSAFAWALAIGDDTRRSSALAAAIGGWKTFDPEAASAAIRASTELSAVEREMLRGLLAPATTPQAP